MKSVPRPFVHCLSFVLGVPTPQNPQTPLTPPSEVSEGRTANLPLSGKGDREAVDEANTKRREQRGSPTRTCERWGFT